MKFGDFIKKNFIALAYTAFVIVLTIVLGIHTLASPSTSKPVIVPDDVITEEVVDEEGGEVVEEEVDPIPDTTPEAPGEVIESNFKDNRTQFILESVDEIDGHKKIVSSDAYDLYLQEENLSIILRNKDSGAVLYSTVKNPDQSNEKWTNFVKSGVVIEYLQGTNIVYYQADMYTGDPSKNVTYNSNGFVAKVSYPDLEFEYELHVSLEDDVLTAHIPIDSIVENSDVYKVANVYVYPFMGYSKMDEEQGYMFLPDGNGSLIHLKNNNGQFTQPYNQMIYGDNAGVDDPYVLSLFNNLNPINENTGITMPVYGVVHSEKDLGFLGIIESGDESARLYVYPNGAILPYNWITPSFVYRQFYNQLTSKTTGTMVIRQENKNNFDITIQYHLLDNEDADYVGMAKVYREYLEDKGAIENQEITYKMRLDFLGTDVKDGLLFRQNVTMTTFEQAVNILNGLREQGVDNTMSVFQGWQKNGSYASLPHKNFKVQNSLGDINQLKTLDGSQEIYLESDLLRYNPSTNAPNSATLMKKLNKRTFQEDVHGRVFKSFNFITPEESVDNADRLSASYLTNGFENISITGISNNLFSYLKSSKVMDRIHSASVYSEIFKSFNDKGLNVSATTPYALYWEYTDSLLDVQVESSNYVFVGEDVPFMSIVLKGKKAMYAPYINFNANHDEYILRMIEYGVYPSFIITHEPSSGLQLTNSAHYYSTEYAQYESQIVSYDAIFKEVHALTNGSVISDHKRDGNVVVVSYENDVRLAINYGDDAVEVEGVRVDGMSYEVVSR